MSRRARRAAATIVAAGSLVVLSCGIATSPAAAANTDFNILVGAESGAISLLAIGPYQAHVEVFELVAGQRQLVTTFSLANRFVKDGREQGGVLLDSIAGWRCDRRTRSFVAFATTPTGQVFGTEVSQVRTPSCSKRFRLTVPRRARPDRRFKATVTDSWRVGGVRPRVCARAPEARRASCRSVTIPAGRTKASRRLRLAARGHWRLELRTRHQRTRRTVAVGVPPRPTAGEKSVLLVGDSMMAQLVDPISDDLGPQVVTDTLLEGGGRLTDPVFDWYRAARRRIASLKPAAAVILIGGGDGFPLRVGAGTVACCSDAWINAYARRVVAMMRTLRRGGRTRVAWVLYPATAQAASREILAAVNSAIRRAAPRVRKVRVADLNPLISPGFVFREYGTFNGRTVKLRAADGMHFTLPGARIAAAHIVRTLGRLR